MTKLILELNVKMDWTMIVMDLQIKATQAVRLHKTIMRVIGHLSVKTAQITMVMVRWILDRISAVRLSLIMMRPIRNRNVRTEQTMTQMGLSTLVIRVALLFKITTKQIKHRNVKTVQITTVMVPQIHWKILVALGRLTMMNLILNHSVKMESITTVMDLLI